MEWCDGLMKQLWRCKLLVGEIWMSIMKVGDEKMMLSE